MSDMRVKQYDTRENKWQGLVTCWECGAELAINVNDLAVVKRPTVYGHPELSGGYKARIVCLICKTENDVSAPQRVQKWLFDRNAEINRTFAESQKP
jgi:hypothetical protein